MNGTVQALEFGTVDGSVIGDGVVAALLYFVVGVLVLVAGFAALDAITPGNLRRQVFVDRNPNAAILLGANHLGLAVIIGTAILSSDYESGLAQGLVDALVFGAIGVVLQALALLGLNAVVPANLRELVGHSGMSGAAWATGTSLFAIALVNAAALS